MRVYSNIFNSLQLALKQVLNVSMRHVTNLDFYCLTGENVTTALRLF